MGTYTKMLITMGAATIKPELKPGVTSKGKHSVRIRITKNRKHAYLHVGISVNPGQWNESADNESGNWIISGVHRKKYNEQIADTIDKLDNIAKANPELTSKEIKLYLTEPKKHGAPLQLVTEFWATDKRGKRLINRFNGYIPVSKETWIGMTHPRSAVYRLDRTILDPDNGVYLVYLI